MSKPHFESGETGDPAEEVLSHLEEAEKAFQTQRREWAETVARLERALESSREVNRELGRHLETLQQDLQAERDRAARNQQRSERLVKALSEVHRALFRGDVHHLILQACLTISQATRGLYVTWRGDNAPPQVRAAIRMEGYPESPPTPFLVELCRRVVERRNSAIYNDPAALADLPRPELPGERFRNCALVPSLVLGEFHGVVLVADREGGEFAEEEVDALLSIGEQAAVALENAHLQRELQRTYVATVAMLADAVEAKDPYTHGHCEEASHYARLTAEELQMSEQERAVVCYAALLHDVGKIGVSDGVLHKPGPLLPEERELVRAHVRVGYDLIRHVPQLESVAEAVLHHHEWYDGSGYPAGLKGEEIPSASRVIAVVDAYGAMITRRSYKDAYSEEYARQELRRCAGTQFDPEVVDAFLRMLDSPEARRGDIADIFGCGMLQDLPQFRSSHPALSRSPEI